MTKPTAGLILAAGLGTRFGGRKLVAPIDGQPMLQHVLDLAAAAELSPVVVVLGADVDAVESACSWGAEIRIRNSAPEQGIATSVGLGIRTLSRVSDAARAVVLLGDQPLLSLQQLDLVLAATGQIVVPRYGGRIGNPVVLDRSIWPLAASLEGDRGFSQVFSAYPNLVTYVDVPGTNPDIDTDQDLADLNRSLA